MEIKNINLFGGVVNINTTPPTSKIESPFLKKKKEEWRDLIGRGKQVACLNNILVYAIQGNFELLKSEIALLKAELADIERNSTLGLVSSGDTSIARNQLTYKILSIIDKFKDVLFEEDEPLNLKGFIENLLKKYQTSPWKVNFYDLAEPINKKLALNLQLSIEEVEAFKASVRSLESEIKEQEDNKLRTTQKEDLNSILRLLEEEIPSHENVEEAFDFLILFMSNWPTDIGVRLVIEEQKKFLTDPTIQLKKKYFRFNEYTPKYKNYIVDVVNRIISNSF